MFLYRTVAPIGMTNELFEDLLYEEEGPSFYARVSTADQSCEMQLRELWDYAERRGLEIIAEYVDAGWSGAKASRPQLDRLMREARLRRFDAVLVWKLDRWGRSVAHFVRSIQELVSLGTRFLAISDRSALSQITEERPQRRSVRACGCSGLLTPPSIRIKNRPVSIRHLGRMIAVTRVADWTSMRSPPKQGVQCAGERDTPLF
jgi:hypothetical protein